MTGMRAFILTLLLGMILATPARALTLVTGDEYQPYTHETLPGGGLTTHLIRAIFREMEEELEIKVLPWARGYLQTERARFDGTYPYIRTRERMEAFHYSEAIYRISNMIYVRAGREGEISTMQDLHGLLLCRPTGYATSEVLEPLVEAQKVRLEQVTDMPTCFRMVQAGRADFLEIGALVGRMSIIKAGLSEDQFTSLPITKIEQGHYLIISKKHEQAQQILDRFNAALAALQSRGEIRRLIDSYMAAYPE